VKRDGCGRSGWPANVANGSAPASPSGKRIPGSGSRWRLDQIPLVGMFSGYLFHPAYLVPTIRPTADDW
jgi:hypothetical protein